MAEFTRRVFLRTGVLGAAGLALGSRLDKLLYAFEKNGDLYSFQALYAHPFGLSPVPSWLWIAWNGRGWGAHRRIG